MPRRTRHPAAAVATPAPAEEEIDFHAIIELAADRVRRLMDRLGARRRAELAAHALRLGIA